MDMAVPSGIGASGVTITGNPISTSRRFTSCSIPTVCASWGQDEHAWGRDQKALLLEIHEHVDAARGMLADDEPEAKRARNRVELKLR